MKRGYVYILSNPGMPGLLKIGHSTRLPKERARELSQATGIPAPFKVEWYAKVICFAKIESEIHARLRKSRINSQREFFRIPVEIATCVATEIVTEFREWERIVRRELREPERTEAVSKKFHQLERSESASESVPWQGFQCLPPPQEVGPLPLATIESGPLQRSESSSPGHTISPEEEQKVSEALKAPIRRGWQWMGGHWYRM